MSVIINELEVAVQPPPEEEAGPLPPPAPPRPPTPLELRETLRQLAERAERVRAD